MVSSGLLRRVAVVRATLRNNPEDTILHSHRRENLKSYMVQLFKKLWFLPESCRTRGTAVREPSGFFLKAVGGTAVRERSGFFLKAVGVMDSCSGNSGFFLKAVGLVVQLFGSHLVSS
jgi:hypothetical protein